MLSRSHVAHLHIRIHTATQARKAHLGGGALKGGEWAVEHGASKGGVVGRGCARGVAVLRQDGLDEGGSLHQALRGGGKCA
eukprot:scaffold135980_cov24-Tisochrysis_lutea.AAC.2